MSEKESTPPYTIEQCSLANNYLINYNVNNFFVQLYVTPSDSGVKSNEQSITYLLYNFTKTAITNEIFTKAIREYLAERGSEQQFDPSIMSNMFCKVHIYNREFNNGSTFDIRIDLLNLYDNVLLWYLDADGLNSSGGLFVEKLKEAIIAGYNYENETNTTVTSSDLNIDLYEPSLEYSEEQKIYYYQTINLYSGYNSVSFYLQGHINANNFNSTYNNGNPPDNNVYTYTEHPIEYLKSLLSLSQDNCEFISSFNNETKKYEIYYLDHALALQTNLYNHVNTLTKFRYDKGYYIKMRFNHTVNLYDTQTFPSTGASVEIYKGMNLIPFFPMSQAIKEFDFLNLTNNQYIDELRSIEINSSSTSEGVQTEKNDDVKIILKNVSDYTPYSGQAFWLKYSHDSPARFAF